MTAEVHGLPLSEPTSLTSSLHLEKQKHNEKDALQTSATEISSTSKSLEDNPKVNKSLDSYLDQTGRDSSESASIAKNYAAVRAASLQHLKKLEPSTNSAFSKAKALFESSTPVKTSQFEVNPDNGEAVRKDKPYLPKPAPKPVRMQNGDVSTPASQQETEGSSQTQTKSIIKISGENVTIIEAKSETSNPASSQVSSENTSAVKPLLNGHSSLSEQLKSVTLSSRQQTPEREPVSTQVRKNDLIADITSAVSGNSSLSLRRAKSRGEGVSCVYQSSKKRNVSSTAAATPAATPSSTPSQTPSATPTPAASRVSNNNVPLNDHMTGDFDPSNFLEKVGKVDAEGRPIPEWRRHVLARHMAEKAQKEFEEKKAVDDYEARFRNMPAWKRALIERREAQAKASEK